MKMRYFISFLALFSLAGCGNSATMNPLQGGANGSVGSNVAVCTSLYAFGLNLTIDLPAGIQADTGLSVRVQDGSYDETITPQTGYFIYDSRQNLATVGAAGERPGTYRVTVSYPGYADQTQSGIVVTRSADGCHVVGQAAVFHF